MDPRPEPARAEFVGRVDELAMVSAALERAEAGTASAVFVAGDAGVGKSALVERACALVDSSTLVLMGRCLQMTAMTVPLLALASAVRSAGADLTPPPGLMEADGAPAGFPVVFDEWLSDLSRDRPVVLVIDDLQWADRSTLDVLMYVLAGPADRHLAVVGTIRSTEAGEGSPLARWLADVRRLPRIELEDLRPLDRPGTAEQLTALFGSSPHQSLVDEVFAHTRGNAYLNRLLVTGVTPDARALPPDLPNDLTSAVLQSWWRLPATAREVTTALALGGEPQTVPDLSEVVAGDVDPEAVRASLRIAVEAGLVDVARDGSHWFHHPMIADALEQRLTDGERMRWHSTFADRAEQRMDDVTPPSLPLLISAADHHHLAGHLPQAYQWSLRAAAAASGTREELRLLQQALDLLPALSEEPADERDLLHRLVSSAAAVGAFREELQAIDVLLATMEQEAEPLLAAELILRRVRLRLYTGQDFFSATDVHRAVALTEADPTSWQHASALVALGRLALWQGDPRVETYAEQALTAARASDDPRALSLSLVLMAYVVTAGDGPRLVEEAVSAAIEAKDPETLLFAMEGISNGPEWAPRRKAARIGRGRELVAALGAPYSYRAVFSAAEAELWLAVGDWRACQDRLREALGSDPGPFADMRARLTSARLAALQGRVDEAQGHLARADELVSDGSQFLGFTFDVTRAVVAMAAGDPHAALTAALAGTVPDVPPDLCEWLLPLAARSLADLIQDERDRGGDPAAWVARLEVLKQQFPDVLYDRGQTLQEPHLVTMTDLYEAEIGRAKRLSDNGEQWVRVAESAHTATLAWVEAYACWRAVEAWLVHRRQGREQAAPVLRRGLALAADLGAESIRQELEALASNARINTASVSDPPAADAVERPGLTAREREILTHVVAGRTYREIARALVISEKTVSSHISNLLRKTGTDNRVDLARWASR